MGQFRKKPVVIEATQWFKNGDHPEDYARKDAHSGEAEGAVVRYFRRPDVDGESVCKKCGDPDLADLEGYAYTMHDHGWIDTLEGGHIVCPGDWIITGVQGERYPCKPDIFEATYEYANLEDDPNYDEDAEDAQAVHDTEHEENIPWEECKPEEDNSVGIQAKGLDGYELGLELTVNGHVGTYYLSHLIFESIKDYWEEETLKAHGMSYKECLLEELDNFNAGLPEGSTPMAFNTGDEECTPPDDDLAAVTMHNQAREIITLRAVVSRVLSTFNSMSKDFGDITGLVAEAKQVIKSIKANKA